MSRSSNVDLGIIGVFSSTVVSGFALGVFIFLADATHCFLAEDRDSTAAILFLLRLLGVFDAEFFLLVVLFFFITRGGFLLVGSGLFLRFLSDCDPIDDEEDAHAALNGNVKLDKSRPPAAASAASTAAATAS